jgi:predicted phosphodiesterase
MCQHRKQKLKLQIASDLHLEFLQGLFPGERLIRPTVDADLLILAGDIGKGTMAIELFKDWPVPVLYLAGNHEFYGHELKSLRDALRKACEGTSITFMDNDTVDCGGVRFLGTTLWTNYRLERNRTQRQLMEHAELRINDHRQIRCGTESFTAQDALNEHEVSYAWLEHQLKHDYDGKTVVVSHHGPHRLSVHPRYIGDASNAAFVSDLSDLLPKADLWIHGHVHDSFDYKLGRCRVVANPLGYPRNRDSADDAGELIFENSEFKWACVVEV